jgi:hypothetical protein
VAHGGTHSQVEEIQTWIVGNSIANWQLRLRA